MLRRIWHRLFGHGIEPDGTMVTIDHGVKSEEPFYMNPCRCGSRP